MDRDPKRFPHKVKETTGYTWYSDKKVLHSNAGWFIGTTCWDPDLGGFEDMGSRESDYFPTEEAAERALATGDFLVRDCPENNMAYQNGLPEPKVRG